MLPGETIPDGSWLFTDGWWPYWDVFGICGIYWVPVDGSCEVYWPPVVCWPPAYWPINPGAGDCGEYWPLSPLSAVCDGNCLPGIRIFGVCWLDDAGACGTYWADEDGDWGGYWAPVNGNCEAGYCATKSIWLKR